MHVNVGRKSLVILTVIFITCYYNESNNSDNIIYVNKLYINYIYIYIIEGIKSCGYNAYMLNLIYLNLRLGSYLIKLFN